MSRGWHLIVGLLALAALAGCAAPAGARLPESTPSTATPSATSRATSAPTPSMTSQASPTSPSTSIPNVTPASSATVAPASLSTAPATQAPAAPHVVIDMKDYAFVPKAITVAPGTVVTWRNDDSTTHTATADDKLFNSGDLGQGAEFSYTFTKPGTYPYYCVWHGAAGGQGMSGTVTVK